MKVFELVSVLMRRVSGADVRVIDKSGQVHRLNYVGDEVNTGDFAKDEPVLTVDLMAEAENDADDYPDGNE